jgi:hypothetical protein
MSMVVVGEDIEGACLHMAVCAIEGFSISGVERSV